MGTYEFTGWVCEDCYLTHHGYDAHELGHEFDPETDGPLSLLEVGAEVADAGLEPIDFSAEACEGCASRLAGTRHALTFWSA